jgi:hypothetical protein
MSDQRGEDASSDAICWMKETDTGTIFAIGVSIDAMNLGADYCRFVFLHELAHLVAWEEHGGDFHERLGKMLDVYNREMGNNLSNDFLEWTYRSDGQLHRLSNVLRIL